MAELRSYPTYKDSGVEWIGRIPKKWDVIKYKRIFKFYNGHGFPDNLQGKKQGDIAFLKVSDIGFNGKYVKESLNYVNEDITRKNKWNRIVSYSILTAKIGEALRKNHRKVNMMSCIIDNNMLALTPYEKYYLNYLYYSLNVVDFDWYSNPGAVPSLNNRQLREDYLMMPTVKEQKNISEYLDKKISQIDALIADKERLITLLEEKRQAVITETVIKGLDPNVKMKDSRIGWIGEVPEHWDYGKIKYFSEMKTGATPSRNNLSYWQDGTINWMSSGEINQEYIYHVNNKITESGLKNSSTSILPVNTVMIALNGQGKTKGKAAVLKVKSACNQSLVGFICDEKRLHYLYLYYFLKVKYRDIRGLVGDGLRDGISLGLLKKLYISLPSYIEQIKIVREIVSQEKYILEAIEKIETQISKLKEYRESLIYEAVTGKIDVRDYAAEKEKVY